MRRYTLAELTTLPTLGGDGSGGEVKAVFGNADDGTRVRVWLNADNTVTVEAQEVDDEVIGGYRWFNTDEYTPEPGEVDDYEDEDEDDA